MNVLPRTVIHSVPRIALVAFASDTACIAVLMVVCSAEASLNSFGDSGPTTLEPTLDKFAIGRHLKNGDQLLRMYLLPLLLSMLYR